MRGELRRSRAAAELAAAPSSPCPHCGRTSKTVQGVCADCWGVKEPDVAAQFRPPPRTEPFLDLWDLDDLLELAPLVVAVGLGVALIVVALIVGLG